MRLKNMHNHVDNWTFMNAHLSRPYHNGVCLYYVDLLSQWFLFIVW